MPTNTARQSQEKHNGQKIVMKAITKLRNKISSRWRVHAEQDQQQAQK